MNGVILSQKRKKVIEEVKEDEKDIGCKFLRIGERLEWLSGDVTTKQEFDEIVRENFKMSVETAYAMIRVWKNRKFIDLEKYGFWKAHEIIKIADEDERHEFEEKYNPEIKPIREVREDVKEFKESKKPKQDSEFCLKFMKKVREAKFDLDNLRNKIAELKGMYQAVIISHKKEWETFQAKDRITKEYEDIIRSIK